ncbi:sensor histidine kinase [Mesorhizobium sp. M1329]|uniref:sensor histidine kinase n=1 Tax=Mesorhizobium sp. M1329 TaxID=2957083 RepID=UPI00333A5517
MSDVAAESGTGCVNPHESGNALYPAYGTVDVAVRRKGNEVVLEVCDKGPGIPEDERAQVLERFYRGSNQNIPGSGLGLSIVQRIAERHGAHLVLDSGPEGKGLLAQVRFHPVGTAGLQSVVL